MDPNKKKIKETKPQKRIPDKKKISKPVHLDLQDIPKPEKLNEIEDDLIETQTPFEYEDDEDFVESELEDEEDTDALEEITPQLSYLLNCDGFEALIKEILSQNSYKTTKNFRFSDKSDLKYETSQKKGMRSM